jgi:hypothetical protein
MDKTKQLEAEVERLKAQDIERQDVIASVRRFLNDSQRNTDNLTSRVSVLEAEVTRAVEHLSRETVHREAADRRPSAFRTLAVSIADTVLRAGSSAADPLERLRAQRREIASVRLFFRARQALGVVRSHVPRVDPSCYGRWFAGGLAFERQQAIVEGVADPARSITESVRVGAVVCHWEEQCRAAAEGEVPALAEGVPQQPEVPAPAGGAPQQPQQPPQE